MAGGTKATSGAGGLHFTIGSAAGYNSSGALDLRQDLALVKATLLYADRAKLCSPGSSVLSAIAEFQEASPEAKARLVVRFLPELQPSMSPQEVRFFEAVVGMRSREEKRRIKKRTRREILALVEKERGELEAMVLEQHSAAGIEGFREAVRSGALEIHPFRQTTAEALVVATVRGGGGLVGGVDLADLIEEFVEQAMGAVGDASTYPLFDDLTGDFVGEAARHGATPAVFGALLGSASDLPTLAGAAAGALPVLGRPASGP